MLAKNPECCDFGAGAAAAAGGVAGCDVRKPSRFPLAGECCDGNSPPSRIDPGSCWKVAGSSWGVSSAAKKGNQYRLDWYRRERRAGLFRGWPNCHENLEKARVKNRVNKDDSLGVRKITADGDEKCSQLRREPWCWFGGLNIQGGAGSRRDLLEKSQKSLAGA